MTEKRAIYKHWGFTFFTSLLFIALIAGEKAPALLSISIAGQAASVLFLTSPQALLTNFVRSRAILIFSFSFLFLLFSFFYSNNIAYLLERLQIKLPILIYALIWPSIGLLTRVQIRIIFYSCILVICNTCIGILINYAFHYEEINQLYLESRIMPGPINHIRFSLMVVFAIYFIYYWLKNFSDNITAFERQLLIVLALVMVIFLHIYSVRSGLLTLYCMFAIVLLNHLLLTKNVKRMLTSLGLIILIGALSFLISPTMRNKLINTKQDVHVYQNNKDPNYNSLATRMVSYKTALEIYSRNKLFGCGQGDLRDENDALFRRDYPSVITPIIPHNQFIYYLAATGITGLIIFTLSFTAPLWFNRFYRIEFMQVGFAILLLAFQFEAMIETQIGVACTLLLVFIPWYFSVKKERIRV